MSTTAVRVLKALTLLQTRREWPGAELAQRLEVDVRTLRRDMGRLRELGYEIESSSGLGGGYRLGAGSSLPALRLDADEAVTVSLALASLDATQPHLHEAALRVLVKLQQILPARLRKRVSDLQSVTLSMSHGPHVNANVLAQVAEACREVVRVRFRYGDSRGRASEREVEPLKLLHTGQTWYLVAWDPGREDWRTFRVDRMQTVRVGEHFVQRKPPDDLENYASHSLGVAPYEQKATLRLKCSVDEAKRRVPSWVGVVEPLGRRAKLSVGGTSPLAIASLLVLADVEFDSLEPRELAGPVRRAGRRLVRGSSEGSRRGG